MSYKSFLFKFSYARLPDSELGLAKCLGPSRYFLLYPVLKESYPTS